MAVLTYGELPFGLRDMAVAQLTTEPATYATKVDVPRAQSAELTEEEDSVEMNAGDVQAAIHTSATRLTGSMQYGGHNIDTLVVLSGGALAATTGMTPNRITGFNRRSTDNKKYFKLTARMLGDDAGDIHLIAYKVKALSGPTFGANQNEFLSENVEIRGVYTAESPGKLYDIISHETVTAIA